MRIKLQSYSMQSTDIINALGDTSNFAIGKNRSSLLAGNKNIHQKEKVKGHTENISIRHIFYTLKHE